MERVQAFALVIALSSVSVVAVGATAAADQRFSDVPGTSPFAADIDWLVDRGITKGYSDGTFRPGEPVSRQAMAAFMRRADSASRSFVRVRYTTEEGVGRLQVLGSSGIAGVGGSASLLSVNTTRSVAACALTASASAPSGSDVPWGAPLVVAVTSGDLFAPGDGQMVHAVVKDLAGAEPTAFELSVVADC